MKISVIMPVLNSAATLRRCLTALQREVSAYEACEVICVDNGSTDESIGILRAFPDVEILEEPQPGAYAARNRGVRAARGDLLAFTDPDCIVAPGWLQAIDEAFRAPSCLVALGLRRPAPDTGLNRLLGDYEITKDRWVVSSGQPLKYYGYTNTMAIRRTAWEWHGPFDERPRGADTIFVRRLVDACGCDTVRFVPAMRVSHLEVDGPVTYLKKAFAYGRSLQSYRQVVPASPLTLGDRLRIFRATCRDHGSGISATAALAGLLIAGFTAWTIGRLAGRLRRL